MNATATRTRPASKGNTATPGQVKTGRELLDELTAEGNPEFAQQVWEQLTSAWAASTCTFEFVSGHISAMIDAKRAAKRLQQSDIKTPVVTDGRYAVSGADGTTKFYRVVNKGGSYKLFVYASDQQHLIGNWRTVLGILMQIAADGEQAAALRFGTELGRCYTCGRTLTDATSRALGQGPDCRSKS